MSVWSWENQSSLMNSLFPLLPGSELVSAESLYFFVLTGQMETLLQLPGLQIPAEGS